MLKIFQLFIHDLPLTWQNAGFVVSACQGGGAWEGQSSGVVRLGSTELALDGHALGDRAGRLSRWVLEEAAEEEGERRFSLNSLPTTVLARKGAEGAHRERQSHPNGAVKIDHLVFASSPGGAARFHAELAGRCGAAPRKVVERQEAGRTYTFFRIGETLIESLSVAEETGHDETRLWGIALRTDDIARSHAYFEAWAQAQGLEVQSVVSAVKDAVQPNRKIFSVRLETHPRLAFISAPNSHILNKL